MRHRSFMKRSVASTGLALCATLAGCAVGPDYKQPEAPKTTAYAPGAKPVRTVVADGRAQQFVDGRRIAADWWRLFECPKLNAIVDDSIAHNANLEAAQATLKASQYTLRAG